jgi:hypothetical protein
MQPYLSTPHPHPYFLTGTIKKGILHVEGIKGDRVGTSKGDM